MKAKERLLKELESLKPHSIMKVYDLVLTLKEKDQGQLKKEKPTHGHLRSRRALKGCTDSLSVDICRERSDRL